jgi:D-inositol-3-phosphate glycosyltransferase
VKRPKMTHTVLHIVDDASWGGVNRLLESLTTAANGVVHDNHKILRIERGRRRPPKIEADVIVSHMAICWKNLPFFSTLRSSYPETPLVHVEHSYSEHYVALNVTHRDRFDDLLNLSYALFDKVIAVSVPQSQWLSRRNYCQPDQLVNIASCVALSTFERVANQIPDGPVTVGAIGRFHEQKGFDILVEAFAKNLPGNINLLLVGDGPERESLLKKSQGKPNIIFQNRTEDPAAAMAQCDIVAMPSRWEPYGLVAIEAMAAQRAILCSRVDGLRQHIASGAIAVEENTVIGWSNALSTLTERSAVSMLPRDYKVDKAEWNFINSWNELIEKLTAKAAANQRAA